MKKLFSRFKINQKKSHGQSLVELALVLAVLLFMVVGVAEYGFLLNEYLNLVDATREAARAGVYTNPFNDDGTIDPNFFTGLANQVEYYMEPLALNPSTDPNVKDDIVISFFGVDDSGNVVRFPQNACNCYSLYGKQTSRFTTADISNTIAGLDAPATGVLLIEVFYDYHQKLHLPIFSNIIPDPIRVYTYAIMPLSAAEPTPTPSP